jgi:glycosyltransferase involved in cell wall biosynthesis
MTGPVRVTVLLAAYNGGAYLREAVDSVLAQTFDGFELLIVDDASTDGSIAALPADARIRVLRNEHNIGQIPSLNRGLREARGEYVARLDHDDVCLPRRLEAQVALLDRSPGVALVATWADIVDTAGRLWTPVRPRVGSFAEFAADVVAGQVFFVHPSLMFRREVVLAVGSFDESLSAAEDHDLYRKLVLARRDARVVEETLLRYRRHEQQMTIANSAAVWQSDGRSYERFLHELAPGAPVYTLRLLLRSDPRFWEEPPLADGELERFLDEAATRLELDPSGRALVGRAVAERVAATLVAGWLGDAAGGYRRRALELARFARRHGSSRPRRLARAYPLLAATSGAGAVLGRLRALAGHALRSEGVEPVRRVARRFRPLRRVYAYLLDTRPRDS